MFYILIAILKLFAHTNRIMYTCCIYIYMYWGGVSIHHPRVRDSSAFLVTRSGPETYYILYNAYFEIHTLYIRQSITVGSLSLPSISSNI